MQMHGQMFMHLHAPARAKPCTHLERGPPGSALAVVEHTPRLHADRLRRWLAYLVLAIAAVVAAQALLNPTAFTG